MRRAVECAGVTYPLVVWVAIGPLLRQRSLEPVSTRSGARSWQVSRHPGAVLLLPARASPPGTGQRVLYGETALECQGGARIFCLGPEPPPPHARSSGLVETWCFLSVAKASIPCQEIGSHYSLEVYLLGPPRDEVGDTVQLLKVSCLCCNLPLGSLPLSIELDVALMRYALGLLSRDAASALQLRQFVRG